MKHPHTVPVLLAATLALGGCSLMEDDASDYLGTFEGTTAVVERGSFEDARTRLDAMVDQIATEMTAAFPDCPPMTRSDETADRVTGGGASDDEISGVWPYELASQSRSADCTIADTRERADTAIEIVTRIAEEYGFGPRIIFTDRIAPNGEGSVSFEGWNADGDKYSFGSIKRTNIRYITGPRFTAEQLDAIERGRTPPQPAPTSLATTTPTTQGRTRRSNDRDDGGHRPKLGPEWIV